MDKQEGGYTYYARKGEVHLVGQPPQYHAKCTLPYTTKIPKVSLLAHPLLSLFQHLWLRVLAGAAFTDGASLPQRHADYRRGFGCNVCVLQRYHSADGKRETCQPAYHPSAMFLKPGRIQLSAGHEPNKLHAFGLRESYEVVMVKSIPYLPFVTYLKYSLSALRKLQCFRLRLRLNIIRMPT